MKRLLIIATLCILLLPLVLAQRGEMTLLTVTQNEDPLDEGRGGTAELYLEMKPGTGQIFMDTFPLSKLDTQSSTRYANQVACSYTGADCERYDFFYTIRSGSTLVGGPSAGAAIAVLTTLMLQGEEPHEGVAITGTIDSGGIIGPVAGIKPKALAAAREGIDTVLISAFAYPTEINRSYLRSINGTNETPDPDLMYTPVNLSRLGIDIVEVATLGEAAARFTGGEAPEIEAEVRETPSYRRTMEQVARDLCDRRDAILDEMPPDYNETDPLNLSKPRQRALAEEDWYSLASYCFRESIEHRTAVFERLSEEQLLEHRQQLMQSMRESKQRVTQRELETMAELETSMIVLERLLDTQEALQEREASSIAFAHERMHSARAWSSFFEMESPRITLDTQYLREACQTRLIEAEERISYIDLFLPSEYLEEAKEHLDGAYRSASTQPALCIFQASKARAQANLLSVTLATPSDRFPLLLEKKLDIVAKVIGEQQRKGFFPILGYSYYRYAQSLADHDPYSALTFAEYALELSNLDMYFTTEAPIRFPWHIAGVALIFVGGLFTGIAAAFALRSRRSSKKPLKKPSKKRIQRPAHKPAKKSVKTGKRAPRR